MFLCLFSNGQLQRLGSDPHFCKCIRQFPCNSLGDRVCSGKPGFKLASTFERRISLFRQAFDVAAESREKFARVRIERTFVTQLVLELGQQLSKALIRTHGLTLLHARRCGKPCNRVTSAVCLA